MSCAPGRWRALVIWAVFFLEAVCFALRGGADLLVGLSLKGSAPADMFGEEVAWAGDVNGDGVPDLLVSAIFADPGGRTNAGSVFLFSGADGSLLKRLDGYAAGDEFGRSVVGIGDVTGDGVRDTLVGAPFADPNGRQEAGSVYLFSGANGSLVRGLDGAAAGDRFGLRAAAVGDVNRDGTPDFLIAAPFASPEGREQAGSVFLFSGASGARLKSFYGEKAGDQFGSSLGAAGDVNRDGIGDILIGAELADPGGIDQAGSAYLFSGANGLRLFCFKGQELNALLGSSVAGAGDVDGDGAPDILVGAIWASPGDRTHAGSVFVFSGAGGRLLRRLNGENSGSEFGVCIASINDINGDSAPELLVGAHFASPAGVNQSGSVYLFSGFTGAFLRRWDGPAPYAFLGRSISPAGDLNGDGLADLLMGAPQAGASGGAWAVSAVGPALIINNGALATNRSSVQLSLPIVGAAWVQFRESGSGQASWSQPVEYAPALSWRFSSGEGLRGLWACCRDFAANVMATVFDDIVLDLTPPQVVIQSPASGSVARGVVKVAAVAGDTLSGVASVAFRLDGATVHTDLQAPYEWTWDTRPLEVAEGAHMLGARALDIAGNVREATASVIVDNTTFDDVPKTSPFWAFVEALYANGITNGCKAAPPLYCPQQRVTRAQMAALICRAAGKSPLYRRVPTFADVPKTHPFYGWIERLADSASWAGAAPTAGCQLVPAKRFCPEQLVRRDQMAKFIAIAIGQAPVTPTGVFEDVPVGSLFAGYIERLYSLGIVSGCAATTYCPGSSVRRDEMAKVFALAFGLAL
jgi:hypothetical protein